MAKHLQITLQDSEYREVQRAAESRDMTIAEWVRHALKSASRRELVANVSKNLDSIHAAAKHSYPTADIDAMLAEIEAGYSDRQA